MMSFTSKRRHELKQIFGYNFQIFRIPIHILQLFVELEIITYYFVCSSNSKPNIVTYGRYLRKACKERFGFSLTPVIIRKSFCGLKETRDVSSKVNLKDLFVHAKEAKEVILFIFIWLFILTY